MSSGRAKESMMLTVDRSLGCVVYEMLIGRPPFVRYGEDSERTFNRILRGETLVDLCKPGADELDGHQTAGLVPRDEAISRAAKHFVVSLLDTDASERLDVTSAKRHAWLEGFVSSFELTWYKHVLRPWIESDVSTPFLTTLESIPELKDDSSRSIGRVTTRKHIVADASADQQQIKAKRRFLHNQPEEQRRPAYSPTQ